MSTLNAWADLVFGCHIFDCPSEDEPEFTDEYTEEDYCEYEPDSDDGSDNDSDDGSSPPLKLTKRTVREQLLKNDIKDIVLIKTYSAERHHPDHHPGEYYLSFLLPTTSKDLVEFFSSGRDFDAEFAKALNILGLLEERPTLMAIASANEDH